MIQRGAAGACLSTLSNAPSTAAKPAADWPSLRAVSWIFSKDGKRSKIFAAAAPRRRGRRACTSTDWFHATGERRRTGGLSTPRTDAAGCPRGEPRRRATRRSRTSALAARHVAPTNIFQTFLIGTHTIAARRPTAGSTLPLPNASGSSQIAQTSAKNRSHSLKANASVAHSTPSGSCCRFTCAQSNQSVGSLDLLHCVSRRGRDCARTSPAGAQSAAPRCTHRAP